MWLAVALAAPTYLPVTSYIIITLDLPQHDFETNIGKAGPALNDDLCDLSATESLLPNSSGLITLQLQSM